jgi:hypothetical protein
MNSTTRILAALLFLASGLGAQSPQTVVIEGQDLHGGGTVTGIRYVHLIAPDAWVIQVTTDQPQSHSAVLRQGALALGGPLWKRVGDRVEEPGGARIAAFDSFTSEELGFVIWNARLRDTPGGPTDDEAVYFEDKLWIQEGPIAPVPGTDFPLGSRWISFDDVRCSMQDGSLLLRGRADDPTVAGPDETFAAFGTLCGSIGILCGLERFAQEGWPALGTGQLIEAVRLEPGTAAIAPTNITAVWSCDLAGPTGSDGCVYKFAYPGQQTLLAQEGTPSPVAGRNWGPLDDPGVHVNSAGAWTLRATLDASDAIIVKDGAVFVRAGDTLPAIAPFTLDGFGRGRALLDQDGHVIWYGHWNEHGHPSEALFRDDQVLVRARQTIVDGQLLVGLSSGPDDLAITPQGGHLLFKGTLVGGLEGAFTLELGAGTQ